MPRPTFLVTVSGPDRVGVGAELFAALGALEGDDVVLMDVAQITLRGTLVLCAEVAGEGLGPEAIAGALATREVAGRGIEARVEAVDPSDEVMGRRLLVTLLAPAIRADQLHRVFAGIASCGATCERIVHLARYPVECYELVVVGPDLVRLRATMAESAGAVGLDVATQRAGLHRRAKHLVVMDADSTLLQDEVIDLLGEACGRADEVAAITAAAMAGEIDFAEALRRRVALLAGAEARVLDEVRARLRLSPGARTLVRTLARLGYVPAVVSGGFVEVLEPLLADLGVAHLAANRLEIEDGRLTGRLRGPVVDRPGKAAALRRFAEEVGVPLAQTVAVGDGANDIDMLSAAGLGIAFNAKPVVAAHADAALSVPYLDAVLYFLGISREEIDEADAADEPDTGEATTG
ncbi:MAG TPA: phosphoserine phosphatase SerB [Acidimicrobiales bacterium]|nr:MAG: phosphoserine phosphatase SerB [Actinobacteria bacterium 21-73-9]HQU26617.1 phosphoserine phosphatase SerB [Acidimicrobiales bacterium]